MMRPSTTLAAVYLCVEPIDFRLQINGIAACVEGTLLLDPLAEQRFAFTNRHYNVSGQIEQYAA
jgi:transposase